MDSTAQRAPRHSDITDELLSRVKDGFDSPNSTYGLRNHQRIAVTSDAWIRQPKQPLGLRYQQRTAVTSDACIRQPKEPLGTQISPTNCSYGRRMDSTAQTALTDSEIINEQLSLGTHGFNSPNSPYGLRNHQGTAITGDAWIRKPKQPLGTQKSSTNCSHG